MDTGEFVKFTSSKYTDQDDYLGAGDILVTKTKGHTAVVLTNGSRYDGKVEEPSAPLGSRILRNGDEGKDVEDLQRRLKAAGYDPGEVDGEYGPNTEAAVRALQKDAGILVDGEFGPDSYAALLALEVDDDAPETEDRPSTGSVLISGGDAYIRTGPGTSYDKAGVAKSGDKLAYANEDNWVPVLVGGRILWVSGKYAKVVSA
ncbi:MAG TPA: peptidoglycan-binding protein [Candidatus Pullichristensenella stercoripullorum]|nr:peptidoglycan-binding protein [Candidatus Pullichristensenella stercoripullorum]